MVLRCGHWWRHLQDTRHPLRSVAALEVTDLNVYLEPTRDDVEQLTLEDHHRRPIALGDPLDGQRRRYGLGDHVIWTRPKQPHDRRQPSHQRIHQQRWKA